MTIGIALAVCIIGGFVCVIAANEKVSELGRLAFAIGLFVVLSGVGDVAALFVR